MNSTEIREVVSAGDLKKYVEFPNRLYKDIPQYIPPFYGDELEDWDREKNPAFEYCEARNFLAYRDGEIVGRIGAILSHKANAQWCTNRMRFTQVDFIDDISVSKALFDTVEKWAGEKGCNQVHGPLGFCDMDREGMLVEGFEHQSCFFTYYNHPYYNEHLSQLGYLKDTDWKEFLLTVPTPESELGQKLVKICDRIRSRNKYHVLDIKKHSEISAKRIEQVFQLVNKAYAPLYGVVELNERQIKKYTKKFLPLVNPDLLALVVDNNDNLVAFGVCAPSVAKAIKNSNGRLFPTGWIGVLKAFSKNNLMDCLLVAVDPELQGMAINALVIERIMFGANKIGIKHAETGPMLETNSKVLGQWKMFDKVQHKRRRCYIKNI